jgi:hypothetical protein
MRPADDHCFSRSRRQEPLLAGKGVTDPIAARAAAGRSPENAIGHKAWPVVGADCNGLFTIGILG